jgi:feruloyl esterase
MRQRDLALRFFLRKFETPLAGNVIGLRLGPALHCASHGATEGDKMKRTAANAPEPERAAPCASDPRGMQARRGAWRALNGPRLRAPCIATVMLVLAACGGDDDVPKKAVPATASSATACNADALATAMPSGTAIASAVAGSAPVPHCRIRGTITSTAPANTVNFSVTLPDTYSGRYFYEAPGGAAGSVGNPQATLLQRGYVVSTSDHGTRPTSSFNRTWINDPGQLLDYNLRAVYNTARAGQALTRAYYKGPQPVSYVMGCSSGGRHVRNHMQNYGTALFDGFMTNASNSHASVSINHTRMAQYIVRNPSSWISPDLALAAQQLIIATYDAVDGVVDGIIQDERMFSFDPSILAQVGFTPEQIALVRFGITPYAHLADPRPTVNGGKMPGYAISKFAEWTNWFLGRIPPPWTLGQANASNGFSGGGSVLAAIYGDAYDWINLYDFNNAQQFQAWTTALGDTAGGAGYNYSRMVDGGGKAIFYVGMGDSAASFKENLIAQKEMALYTPTIDDHTRLYFVPGWGHCAPSGGGGPDAVDVQNRMLDALIDWVENGRPAGAVEAVRTATTSVPQRTFLLCPEPQIAVYKGAGADAKLAASWTCQAANLPQLFP